MKEEVKNRLLIKLANGTITKEEYHLLEIEALDDDFLFEAIQGYVQSEENHQITDIQEKISASSNIAHSSQAKTKIRPLWRYTSAAAVFLLLLTLGIWTFNFSSSNSKSNETYVEQKTKVNDGNQQPQKSITKPIEEVKPENPKTSEYRTPAFDEISESEEPSYAEKEEEAETEIQVQATSQYDEEGAYDVVIGEKEVQRIPKETASVEEDLQSQKKSKSSIVHSKAVANTDEIDEKSISKNKGILTKRMSSPQKTQKVSTRTVFFKDEDGVPIVGDLIDPNTGKIIHLTSNNSGISLPNKDLDYILYNPAKGKQETTIYKDQNQVQLTSFSWKNNSIYFPKVGWNTFYQTIDKHRGDAPSEGKINLMIHINKVGNIELIEVSNKVSEELSEFTKAVMSYHKEWIVLPNNSSFQFPLQIIW